MRLDTHRSVCPRRLRVLADDVLVLVLDGHDLVHGTVARRVERDRVRRRVHRRVEQLAGRQAREAAGADRARLRRGGRVVVAGTSTHPKINLSF